MPELCETAFLTAFGLDIFSTCVGYLPPYHLEANPGAAWLFTQIGPIAVFVLAFFIVPISLYFLKKTLNPPEYFYYIGAGLHLEGAWSWLSWMI